jgi:hypothetical protein
MARSEIHRLFRNGLISKRELRRARGMRQEYAGAYGAGCGPNGAIDSDHIGASDASEGADAIDKKENRRSGPKGSTPRRQPNAVGRSRNTTGWPSDAQVRRMSANEFHPGWYSAGPTRQE